MKMVHERWIGMKWIFTHCTIGIWSYKGQAAERYGAVSIDCIHASFRQARTGRGIRSLSFVWKRVTFWTVHLAGFETLLYGVKDRAFVGILYLLSLLDDELLLPQAVAGYITHLYCIAVQSIATWKNVGLACERQLFRSSVGSGPSKIKTWYNCRSQRLGPSSQHCTQWRFIRSEVSIR